MYTRYIAVDQDMVFIGSWSTTLDCSGLTTQNIVFVGEDETGMWAERKPFDGRDYEADFTEALSLFAQAQTIKDQPEPEPEPSLYVLTTDLWEIPADGVTPATITYTTNDPAKFSVDNTSYELVPEGGKIIFEIVADAPGPIEIKVKDQLMVLTAVEVV